MKIKYLIVASLLLFIGMGVSHAEDLPFRVPVSNNRISDPGLQSAGVNSVVVVTSTSAALATDAEGDTMTNGLIYWIAFSTVPTLYLEVRGSTDTANLTSTKTLPFIMLNTTAAALSNFVINFNPPIPWDNGLSLNLAPAGSTPVAGFDDIAVGVRWRK